MSENHADVSGKNSPRYGTHLSEYQKERIREANKNRVFSEETRMKISKAMKGKTHTNEAKEKMSLNNYNASHSGEDSFYYDKKPEGCYSNYLSVSFHKFHQKWVASIKNNKKRIYLGYFETEYDAAKAYNDYIIQNKLNRKLNDIGS